MDIINPYMIITGLLLVEAGNSYIANQGVSIKDILYYVQRW
ncbi:hypothetical protein [Niallia sp. NCCP-28]|nr:hypothetical protein [Niallia sp. NCCP-28]